MLIVFGGTNFDWKFIEIHAIVSGFNMLDKDFVHWVTNAYDSSSDMLFFICDNPN